jgi:HSP20 family protein
MSKKSKEVPAERQARDTYPTLDSLRDEVDRLFDDFAVGWPFASPRRAGLFDRLRGRGKGGAFAGPMPDVDVIEKDKTFEIRAELPGVDEADIDLRVVDDAVILKAEKREERKEGEEGGSYYVSECRYGSLERIIPLPAGVDASEPDATFKKGVLSVRFPKRPEHHDAARRIEVRSA